MTRSLGCRKWASASSPRPGGSQTLPRVVGRAQALAMTLTGDFIDAAEAYRIGLVHRVVPRDRLYETAQALADRLLQQDPVIVQAAKRVGTPRPGPPLSPRGWRWRPSTLASPLSRRKRNDPS